MCVGVTLQCGYGGAVSVCRLRNLVPQPAYGYLFIVIYFLALYYTFNPSSFCYVPDPFMFNAALSSGAVT